MILSLYCHFEPFDKLIHFAFFQLIQLYVYLAIDSGGYLCLNIYVKQ